MSGMAGSWWRRLVLRKGKPFVARHPYWTALLYAGGFATGVAIDNPQVVKTFVIGFIVLAVVLLAPDDDKTEDGS
jgi:hypothetical protein